MDRDIEVLRRVGIDVIDLLRDEHRANPENHFIAARYGARLLEKGEIKSGISLFQRRLLFEDPSGNQYDHYQILVDDLNPELSLELLGKTLIIDCRQNGFGDIIFFSRVVPHLAKCASSLLLVVPLQLYSLLSFFELDLHCKLLTAVPDDLASLDSLSCLRVDIISAALALWAHDDSSLFSVNVKSTLPFFTAKPRQACLFPFAAEKFRRLLNLNLEDDLSRRSMTKNEIKTFKQLPTVQHYSELAVFGHHSDYSPWWDEPESPKITQFPNDFLELAKIISEFSPVFAVDSAVFHLCGLLGIDTTLILPRVPDWRYGNPYISLDGNVRWYKNAKVFPSRLPL